MKMSHNHHSTKADRYPALLRQLRQSVGWSQVQFAAQVGVTA